MLLPRQPRRGSQQPELEQDWGRAIFLKQLLCLQLNLPNIGILLPNLYPLLYRHLVLLEPWQKPVLER